jgi:hypothetical protein
MAEGPADAESDTWLLVTADERHEMTADILKRKIRNFPAANLSLRIATA